MWKKKEKYRKKFSLPHKGGSKSRQQVPNRWRGPCHYSNKPNDSERWVIYFSFHLSLFSVLSLSLSVPGGRQVVTFSLPPTSCLDFGDCGCYGIGGEWGTQRGAQKTQSQSQLFPFSSHSCKAYRLPMKCEQSKRKDPLLWTVGQNQSPGLQIKEIFVCALG
jgi:hypothetical protein